MHKYWALGSLCVYLAAACPIPTTVHSINDTQPDSHGLRRSNFDTSAIMLAGATQLAVQVPSDNSLHLATNLLCLDLAASAVGSCGLDSIDHISAAPGFTCTFVGSAGWMAAQNGDVDHGWLQVGPPQRLAALACQRN